MIQTGLNYCPHENRKVQVFLFFSLFFFDAADRNRREAAVRRRLFIQLGLFEALLNGSSELISS